jgi:hypothetical protein
MPDWLYVSFKIIDEALKEEETTFQHASSST